MAKLLAMEAYKGLRSRQRRADVTVQFRDAVGAIVGNLLVAWAQDRPVPTSRSLDRNTFTGEPIGARVFADTIELMAAYNLLRQRRGGRSKDGKAGIASRFFPTHVLLRLAAEYGVDQNTARSDFRQYRRATTKAPKVRELIVVKPIGAQPKLPSGGRLPIDRHDPIAATLRAEVEALNTFAATVVVDGCTPPRWQRQFRHDFRLYGRLHAVGDGNYQNMRQEDRLALIRINGEPVVEVDIGSSHLSLMHGLLRLPLPEGDLYDVPGLPREVVKAWINATLGNGRPHRRWPEEFLAKKPSFAGYPIQQVASAVIARYPWMAEPAVVAQEFAHIAPPHRVLPHLLMGIEAEVMMATVQALRAKMILALPMHDGLIMPASAEEIACRLLREAGERIAVVTLRLKVDRPSLPDRMT